MKNTAAGLYAWLAQTAFTAIACMFMVIIAASSSGAEMFPIATGGAAQSGSFDGNNYLIAVENLQTTPPTIAAQMIDANGVEVGSPITTGRSGIASSVAFDGTNYLMIWEDDGLNTLDETTGWQVYGQFISMAGTAVGSPFAISTPGIWFDGTKVMAFGGGKYLVTYTRLIDPELAVLSNNCYIAGRVVDPNGTMGSEFRVSTEYGAASDVSFDGANFFVIWREASLNQEIRGRFVSPDGSPGTEIPVNASAASSYNPKSVAFDGTNYLVVWNDNVGAGNWDVFGQFISPAGDLVGGVITISNEPGPQLVTSVAFDGSSYLSVWIDMANDANVNGACDAGESSCWDVYGQYISKSGTLVGSKVTITTDAGNQMGVVGFANGKYLALVNSGVTIGQGGIYVVEASYGVFIYPPPEPGLCGSSDTGTFSSPPTANLCEPDAVVSLTPTATGWSWSCPGQHGGDPASCSANRTPPSGTVQINGGATYATTTATTLTLSATGTNGVAVTQMRFSNDGEATGATDWEAYTTTRNITLSPNGSISVQFKDAGGLLSAFVTDTIILVPTEIIQINNVATDFGSIDTALDSISLPSKTVKVRDLLFLEDVTMTSPVMIVLKGGYPVNGFGSSQPPGTYTTIAGSMKISSGTLKVDRVKIK